MRLMWPKAVAAGVLHQMTLDRMLQPPAHPPPPARASPPAAMHTASSPAASPFPANPPPASPSAEPAISPALATAAATAVVAQRSAAAPAAPPLQPQPPCPAAMRVTPALPMPRPSTPTAEPAPEAVPAMPLPTSPQAPMIPGSKTALPGGEYLVASPRRGADAVSSPKDLSQSPPRVSHPCTPVPVDLHPVRPPSPLRTAPVVALEAATSSKESTVGYPSSAVLPRMDGNGSTGSGNEAGTAVPQVAKLQTASSEPVLPHAIASLCSPIIHAASSRPTPPPTEPASMAQIPSPPTPAGPAAVGQEPLAEPPSGDLSAPTQTATTQPNALSPALYSQVDSFSQPQLIPLVPPPSTLIRHRSALAAIPPQRLPLRKRPLRALSPIHAFGGPPWGIPRGRAGATSPHALAAALAAARSPRRDHKGPRSPVTAVVNAAWCREPLSPSRWLARRGQAASQPVITTEVHAGRCSVAEGESTHEGSARADADVGLARPGGVAAAATATQPVLRRRRRRRQLSPSTSLIGVWPRRHRREASHPMRGNGGPSRMITRSARQPATTPAHSYASPASHPSSSHSPTPTSTSTESSASSASPLRSPAWSREARRVTARRRWRARVRRESRRGRREDGASSSAASTRPRARTMTGASDYTASSGTASSTEAAASDANDEDERSTRGGEAFSDSPPWHPSPPQSEQHSCVPAAVAADMPVIPYSPLSPLSPPLPGLMSPRQPSSRGEDRPPAAYATSLPRLDAASVPTPIVSSVRTPALPPHSFGGGPPSPTRPPEPAVQPPPAAPPMLARMGTDESSAEEEGDVVVSSSDDGRDSGDDGNRGSGVGSTSSNCGTRRSPGIGTCQGVDSALSPIVCVPESPPLPASCRSPPLSIPTMAL